MQNENRVVRSLLAIGTLGFATAANAELGLNFPPPASQGAQEIYDIHMLTATIATVLTIAVFVVVLFAVFRFRKSRGYEADQNFHKTWFGRWSWILVPAMVLGIDLTIAGSAQKVLENLWVVPKDKNMMDVKVIGHQWYWEFEYLDQQIKVESRYTPEEEAGDLYLREVDNRLVLPTHTPIRFLHTSVDVLHAFWVPELGFKKDAIPGYVTETWAEINREGIFRGQCAELCGTWHSRMPIVVEAVSPEKFEEWVSAQKVALAAKAAEAASDKEWSMAELIEKGKGLYNTNCGSCHQVNGEGLPPAFPPLKGSQIATGPLADHISIVLNGKPGTAMPAWAQLNDLEIAAIVTYERNAWGNDTGDVVQPKDIKAAR
ncbi:MAG: cytochrome c oxidase subunit II [Gammaproteobacteria bacterium]